MRICASQCTCFRHPQSSSIYSQRQESTTSVWVKYEMFTWRYKSTVIATFFTWPFQICCLKPFWHGLYHFVNSVWTISAIKLLFLVLVLIEQTGDKSLSILLYLWAFFPTWPRYQSPHRLCFSLSFWTMLSLFAFHAVWKAALFFIFSGVVLWTLLFMYLVTSLKCLALLQGQFCNFACFTNAS